MTLAALVLALTLPAAAQDSFDAASTRARFILAGEGASGVSFRPQDLSVRSDWKTIMRHAVPHWPLITFPDRLDYRIASLCVDGSNLRVIGKPKGEICHSIRGEEECQHKEIVELVVPIGKGSSRCLREEWYVDRETQSWKKRCLAREELTSPRPLTYPVEVRAYPQRVNGSDGELIEGRTLFIKPYTIRGCAEAEREAERPSVPLISA